MGEKCRRLGMFGAKSIAAISIAVAKLPDGFGERAKSSNAPKPSGSSAKIAGLFLTQLLPNIPDLH